MDSKLSKKSKRRKRCKLFSFSLCKEKRHNNRLITWSLNFTERVVLHILYNFIIAISLDNKKMWRKCVVLKRFYLKFYLVFRSSGTKLPNWGHTMLSYLVFFLLMKKKELICADYPKKELWITWFCVKTFNFDKTNRLFAIIDSFWACRVVVFKSCPAGFDSSDSQNFAILR